MPDNLIQPIDPTLNRPTPVQLPVSPLLSRPVDVTPYFQAENLKLNREAMDLRRQQMAMLEEQFKQESALRLTDQELRQKELDQRIKDAEFNQKVNLMNMEAQTNTLFSQAMQVQVRGEDNQRKLQGLQEKYGIGSQDWESIYTPRNGETQQDAVLRGTTEMRNNIFRAMQDPIYKDLVDTENLEKTVLSDKYLSFYKTLNDEGSGIWQSNWDAYVKTGDKQYLQNILPGNLARYVEDSNQNKYEVLKGMYDAGQITQEQYYNAMAGIKPSSSSVNPRNPSGGVTATGIPMGTIPGIAGSSILDKSGGFTTDYMNYVKNRPENAFTIEGAGFTQGELYKLGKEAIPGTDTYDFQFKPREYTSTGRVIGDIVVNNETAAKAISKKTGKSYQEATDGKTFTFRDITSQEAELPIGEGANAEQTSYVPQLESADFAPQGSLAPYIANIPGMQVANIDLVSGKIIPVGKTGAYMSANNLVVGEAIGARESPGSNPFMLNLYQYVDDPEKGEKGTIAVGAHQMLWRTWGDMIKKVNKLDQLVPAYDNQLKAMGYDPDQVYKDTFKELARVGKDNEHKEIMTYFGYDKKSDSFLNPARKEEMKQLVLYARKPLLQSKAFEYYAFTHLYPEVERLKADRLGKDKDGVQIHVNKDQLQQFNDMQLAYLIHHEGSPEKVAPYINSGGLLVAPIDGRDDNKAVGTLRSQLKNLNDWMSDAKISSGNFNDKMLWVGNSMAYIYIPEKNQIMKVKSKSGEPLKDATDKETSVMSLDQFQEEFAAINYSSLFGK